MKYKVKALFGFMDKKTKESIKKDDEFVCTEERLKDFSRAGAVKVIEEIKPKKTTKKK